MRRLPEPVADNWDWQVMAACRGMDVEVFFHASSERSHVRDERIAMAKAVCQRCPVLGECRAHALATREPYGVWGGLSESDRALLLGVRTLRHPGPRQPGRRVTTLDMSGDASSNTQRDVPTRYGLGGTAGL